MPNTKDTITEAVVRGLQAYLTANVAGILAVYEDFPTPTQDILMPSISIFTGSPTFQPAMNPYIISRGAQVAAVQEDPPADPPAIGKYPVRRVVGEYEFKLQVDLWCKNKLERHEMYQKFFTGFNQTTTVMGLRILLTEYFSEYASYDITGFEFIDGEQASQRGEWRARIAVTATCKAVIQVLEHLVAEIDNQLSTPLEIEDEDEDEVFGPII